MLTLMSGSKFFIFYFFAKKKSVVDSARRQTDALTMQLHRLFNHALFFKHAFLVLNVHGRQTLQRDYSRNGLPVQSAKNALSLPLAPSLTHSLTHTHAAFANSTLCKSALLEALIPLLPLPLSDSERVSVSMRDRIRLE
jgi:hypothetical protein